MDIRRVGKSGLRVSAVGLGCNNFGWTIDEPASQKVVDRALDCGVTLFDTADFYGKAPGDSEAVLGRVLGDRRKDVVLVTKFGVDMAGDGSRRDSSRGYVMKAVEASLRRLGTDWIDIYMIHWPDFDTPIAETLGALDDLVRSGKVRYAACSNLPPWRIADAQWTARHHGLGHFIAAESQYSVIARDAEKELIPVLDHYGMGLLPYFPLASGLLTGKYTGESPAAGRLTDNFLRLGDVFLTERNLETAKRLDRFAQSRDKTLLELAISWLAAQPLVPSVVCGATEPEQVEQNVRAAGWKFTAEELAEVDRITGEA